VLTHDAHQQLSFSNTAGSARALDVMDIVESDDVKQIEKAAMLIRPYGRSKTETPLAASGVFQPALQEY